MSDVRLLSLGMRWFRRRGWLVCMPMLCMAAACRLYSGELLSPRAADSGARDAGVAGSFPGARCGDGEISGPEKCDIGIARDAPGACPTDCPALASCAPRALNGTGCQAECVLLVVSCGAHDDCCPADCVPGSDDDCSTACGDGIVDGERGETCESSSQTPCPTRDDDCADADPCTTDRVLGSAQSCSALCVHLPTNMRTPNDGCCPPGANATEDSDCKLPCSGEDCAGDTDAGAVDAFCGAMLTLSDCQRCSCDRCAQTYLACREGGTAEDNARCSAVLDCAERAPCAGDTCYCGSAPTIPACLIPSGPCRQEVEMAAGSTDAAMIRERSRDPQTPLGRATAAIACRASECNGACSVGERR